jgi:hypothetical protein
LTIKIFKIFFRTGGCGGFWDKNLYPSIRGLDEKMDSFGGLELGLLVLESILLVATLVLLMFSIKEGRERDKLIMEVGRATKILTRHEYFITVTDNMMDSKEEVIGCITGRLPTGEDKKRTRDVVTNIEKLTRAGVKVKYLLPKFHDRLHVGWLYTQAGAEVRYSAFPQVDDFRYMVVDSRVSIIGIPERIGETQATKKGYCIPSEGLSSILKEHFNKSWDEGITYEQYVKETLQQTGASPRALAKELEMDESELRRFS